MSKATKNQDLIETAADEVVKGTFIDATSCFWFLDDESNLNVVKDIKLITKEKPEMYKVVNRLDVEKSSFVIFTTDKGALALVRVRSELR